MEDRSLIDVGFIGSKFSRRHGVSLKTRKAARLDQALCCEEWRRLFPAAVVRHLSHSLSDHFSILLDLSRVQRTVLGVRPFKFQAAWTLHSKFPSWMERE